VSVIPVFHCINYLILINWIHKNPSKYHYQGMSIKFYYCMVIKAQNNPTIVKFLMTFRQNPPKKLFLPKSIVAIRRLFWVIFSQLITLSIFYHDNLLSKYFSIHFWGEIAIELIMVENRILLSWKVSHVCFSGIKTTLRTWRLLSPPKATMYTEHEE